MIEWRILCNYFTNIISYYSCEIKLPPRIEENGKERRLSDKKFNGW